MMEILRDIDRVDDATLQRMSYRELVELEDALLLKNEVQQVIRIRFTAGRFVLFLLGATMWGVLVALTAVATRGLPDDLRGMVSFVAVFVTLGLSVYLSQRVWQAIGTGPRMFFRYALHYWPVLLVVVGTIVVQLRG